MKIVICAEKMVDTQSNTTPTTWDAGTMKIWRRKAIYQERTVVDVKEEWFIIPHEETSRMSQSRLSYHYSIPWPTSFFSAMPWHKILTEPSKLAPWCFWSPRKHPGTYSRGLGTRIREKKFFGFLVPQQSSWAQSLAAIPESWCILPHKPLSHGIAVCRE